MSSEDHVQPTVDSEEPMSHELADELAEKILSYIGERTLAGLMTSGEARLEAPRLDIWRIIWTWLEDNAERLKNLDE